MEPFRAANATKIDDTTQEMEKLRFVLAVEDEDGWPPVAGESVWCERSGDVYELQNAPFFINGIARGDKFVAETDPIDGSVLEFQITQASGHSLVWVINNNDLDFTEERRNLLDLGCSIEGFSAFHLRSIDVPPSVEIGAINAVVDRLEKLGFSVAYPVWRHGVIDT
jgi:hypothetical protein